MTVHRSARRLRSVWAVLLVLLLAVTGCAKIPQSSPVRTVSADPSNEALDLQYRITGPTSGQSPEQVIEGFLEANKGVQESFTHARDFLSTAQRDSWNPEAKTTVYNSYPKITATSDPLRFELQYQPVAVIDANGIRQDTPNAPTKSVAMKLVEENGNYRLDSAPEGIVISSADAKTLVEQRNLYFYSPDYGHAVADTRWFLKSPSRATSVTNALLAGPAPHLRGAVATALGEGAKLANPAVAVDDKTAQVDLDAKYWNGLKPLQRAQLKQQLELSLVGMAGIDDVLIKTDSRPVPESGIPADGFIQVSANPEIDESQVGVSNRQLVSYTKNAVQRIPEIPDTAEYAPRAPAMSYSRKLFAFLNASGSQLLVTGSGRDVTLAQQGYSLTPPTFDTLNWIWTVVTPARGETQEVRASSLQTGGAKSAVVSAEWLQGYTVRSLRVARDGVRVAIVADRDGRSTLFITSIIRDSEQVPIRLNPGAAVPTGQSRFSSVRWLNDSRMVVADVASKDTVTPTIVSAGGIEEVLAPQAGTSSFSVGMSADQIYLIANGRVYYRVGNNWYDSKASMTGINFAG